MRKLAPALLVIFVLLPGCATTANLEARLNTYIGRTELEVVRKVGPPTETFETGGSRFLVYKRSSNIHIPETPPQYQVTGIGPNRYVKPVGGSPVVNIQEWCNVTFEVIGEKVVDYRMEGNHCVSN